MKVTQDRDLQVALSEVANRNYRLTSQELADKTKYFAFQDQGASERIHRQIHSLDLSAIKRNKRRATIISCCSYVAWVIITIAIPK